VWRSLPVDIFPDISVPRVTIQTECGALTAEEVEQLVTIPIESAVNGVPGVAKIRSSSSGGLSFVWIDFNWDADLARARFDVFERLSRIEDSLPEEVHTEITPIVSVTGEIMLVALTVTGEKLSNFELREIAEYDLRTRLLGVPGIGEVAVIGSKLPEFRIEVDPVRAAQHDITLSQIVEAARNSRTFLSAGYLPDYNGEEVSVNQIARADTIEEIRSSVIPLQDGGSLRLQDVATVEVRGEYRRGSSSFNGKEAVVLSIQKVPGSNTLELTEKLEKVLANFEDEFSQSGVQVHKDAYRQADFIEKSVAGGSDVVRDAAIIVVLTLFVSLFELRTIIVVLCTMPLSILLGVMLFPMFGIGVNVMTLGGIAVAAGDIVDAAIIFTEVIRRKLGENAKLPESQRDSTAKVIVSSVLSVLPSVAFSSFLVILVFLPLFMLSGLEGQFFKPLAISYICIFMSSLACAVFAVPSLAYILRIGGLVKSRTSGIGVRLMQLAYSPVLKLAVRFPKVILLAAVTFLIVAIYVASGFGASFLPSFREDSYNVILALPPGASLTESERISESAVPHLMKIPGVLSVTRRTGRAERDQHAEPVSSSEFVVRVDLNEDAEKIKSAIRRELGNLPGCALVIGYPIAHRISAVLSGSEAELAINLYGEDLPRLRKAASEIKAKLDEIDEVADVRANREITVNTIRILYDHEAMAQCGITLKEAGEQVSYAFNGAVVGEVRNGMKKRSLTVRMAGDESEFNIDTLKSFLLTSSTGNKVRLADIAHVFPVESSNLVLRESLRRKALVTCNPASGVDIGRLVEILTRELSPIALQNGVSIDFGGSYKARESASRTLAFASIALFAIIIIVLVCALGNLKAAILALVNVPLGLIGSVIAVALADSVLSVSSLIGFVTVIGFQLRNGILMLNCYREKLNEGFSLHEAILKGSQERMVTIVLTSATTVLGLVPIVFAGAKAGGELLAPLAIVQFGGLLGATILNLIVLPPMAVVFGIGNKGERR
jgi:HME family heavy-metal exporter